MNLPRPKSISAAKLKEWMDNGADILVIDLRDELDYEVYHMEHAVNIPKKNILDAAGEIPKDIPVVLYCKYGAKSPTVIKNLMKEGNFSNLYSLQDGLFEWAKEYERDKLYFV